MEGIRWVAKHSLQSKSFSSDNERYFSNIEKMEVARQVGYVWLSSNNHLPTRRVRPIHTGVKSIFRDWANRAGDSRPYLLLKSVISLLAIWRKLCGIWCQVTQERLHSFGSHIVLVCFWAVMPFELARIDSQLQASACLKCLASQSKTRELQRI